MTTWTTAKADEVTPGDRIKLYGQELAVTRVDTPFLGQPTMVLFVESTPERWHCLPASTETELEIQT